MNKDVLDHIIKLTEHEMDMCKLDLLIHEGGKESALETYEKVVKALTKMKAKK